VDQNHGGGRHLERPADDFARIDGRVIDGALRDHLVPHQIVPVVEIEHAELLPRTVGERQAHIGLKRGPGGNDRPAAGFDPGHPHRQFPHDLQVINRARFRNTAPGQFGPVGRQDGAQTAEARQEVPRRPNGVIRPPEQTRQQISIVERLDPGRRGDRTGRRPDCLSGRSDCTGGHGDLLCRSQAERPPPTFLSSPTALRPKHRCGRLGR